MISFYQKMSMNMVQNDLNDLNLFIEFWLCSNIRNNDLLIVVLLLWVYSFCSDQNKNVESVFKKKFTSSPSLLLSLFIIIHSSDNRYWSLLLGSFYHLTWFVIYRHCHSKRTIISLVRNTCFHNNCMVCFFIIVVYKHTSYF